MTLFIAYALCRHIKYSLCANASWSLCLASLKDKLLLVYIFNSRERRKHDKLRFPAVLAHFYLLYVLYNVIAFTLNVLTRIIADKIYLTISTLFYVNQQYCVRVPLKHYFVPDQVVGMIRLRRVDPIQIKWGKKSFKASLSW